MTISKWVRSFYTFRDCSSIGKYIHVTHNKCDNMVVKLMLYNAPQIQQRYNGSN